jgi:outer membrane biosynthesis protein TonB
MQKPFISFSAAFLIWLTLLVVFSSFIFKKTITPQVALEIDASMFGDIAEEKKIAKKSYLKKTDLDQSSDLKKSEQKVLQHDHHLADNSENKAEKKVAVLSRSLPQIPDDLRDEAFSSEAIARFYIAQDGSIAKVELIKPCANPRLNYLLLKSLKNWKFAPSSTSSTQDIKVHFLVK